MAGVELTAAFSLTGQYRGAAVGGMPVAILEAISQSYGFTTGSGTGLFGDLLYQNSFSIAASGTQNFDLAGSLADAFGTTLTFVHVSAIIVIADAANVNDVVVGAGTNPFTGPLGGTTPTISVRPGGLFVDIDPGPGWTVTAATGDILKLANSGSGTGVTGKLIIFGKSV